MHCADFTWKKTRKNDIEPEHLIKQMNHFSFIQIGAHVQCKIILEATDLDSGTV